MASQRADPEVQTWKTMSLGAHQGAHSLLEVHAGSHLAFGGFISLTYDSIEATGRANS